MTKRGNFNVSRREFIEAGAVASIGTLLKGRCRPPSRRRCRCR